MSEKPMFELVLSERERTVHPDPHTVMDRRAEEEMEFYADALSDPSNQIEARDRLFEFFTEFDKGAVEADVQWVARITAMVVQTVAATFGTWNPDVMESLANIGLPKCAHEELEYISPRTNKEKDHWYRRWKAAVAEAAGYRYMATWMARAMRRAGVASKVDDEGHPGGEHPIDWTRVTAGVMPPVGRQESFENHNTNIRYLHGSAEMIAEKVDKLTTG